MAIRRDTRDGVRENLIETLEVQLSAMRTGIAFWADWAKSAITFTEVASRGLVDIATRPDETVRVLGEVTEACIAYWRMLDEQSGAAVQRFQDELAESRKASSARTNKRKDSPGSRTRKQQTAGSTSRVRAKD